MVTETIQKEPQYNKSMQDNNTKTKKVYRFKTIVTTDYTRERFTELRNKLKSSDKQLMDVLFNLGVKYADEVASAVEFHKESNKVIKEKVTAKKAAKKKPAKKVTEPAAQEKVTVVHYEDDVPCLVVVES